MKKLSVVLLAILLAIISFIVVLIYGNTYTISINDISNVNSIDELDITIEDDIVKLTNKKFENGVLTLDIESVSEGKTYLTIYDKDNTYIEFSDIYVHKFGIITYQNFFGNTKGSRVIPISIAIWLAYVLFLLFKKYFKELNINFYQYKNVVYLGLIIFLTFSFINQLYTIANYHGLIDTIRKIIGLCSTFSIVIFPFAFLTAILVTISNIVLVIKEGMNVRNLLGVLLGLFFCVATILPDKINEILQSATWIDVHNEQGFGRYLQDFIEFTVYVSISYLECILLATIILGLKAAKHMPKFNKDFIIILGCQIRSDGTLTNLLKIRVDRAIEFYNLQKEKTGKELVFIPSGGQGNDEVISEAQAMKNYLIENGINENKILVEDKSKNTYENIKFSYNIINNKVKDAQIAISTTNYHVYRAGAIAHSQGINVEGIGAKTKTYFWINAFIREYIAALFSERKKHFAIIFNALLIAIAMIGLLYLSNIL